MTRTKIPNIPDCIRYNVGLPGSSLCDFSLRTNSFFGALVSDWLMRFVQRLVCLVKVGLMHNFISTHNECTKKGIQLHNKQTILLFI